jgi:signal transduction histidine kinase
MLNAQVAQLTHERPAPASGWVRSEQVRATYPAVGVRAPAFDAVPAIAPDGGVAYVVLLEPASSANANPVVVDYRDGCSLKTLKGSNLISAIVIDPRAVMERKETADRLQHSLDALLTVRDVGRRLGSRLKQQAIAAALLEAAARVAPLEAGVVLLRKPHGRLRLAHAFGPQRYWYTARKAGAAQAARHEVRQTALPRSCSLALPGSGAAHFRAWVLPLRVQDEVIGVLEVYGQGLVESAEHETLSTLVDQAAGALERTRLYHDLAERERRLQDLARRLFQAHDEARRHLAYDIHDGVAQLAAAAHKHLEAFACRYRPRSDCRRDELAAAVDLTGRAVQEARRLIAGLRPKVLDDFGLTRAIALEVEAFRAEGWQVDYTDSLGTERLPHNIETALFRVVQEALANVRKHADSRRVAITITRRSASVYLQVRDWGRGFRLASVVRVTGSSERVGLAGIRARVRLLRGRCCIRSQPGKGTRISVEVPLSQ